MAAAGVGALLAPAAGAGAFVVISRDGGSPGTSSSATATDPAATATPDTVRSATTVPGRTVTTRSVPLTLLGLFRPNSQAALAARYPRSGYRCFGPRPHTGFPHSRDPSFTVAGRGAVTDFVNCGERDGPPNANGRYSFSRLPTGTLTAFSALLAIDQGSARSQRSYSRATVEVRLGGRTVCTASIAGPQTQACRAEGVRIPTGGGALEVTQTVTPASQTSDESLFVGLIDGSLTVEVTE